MEGMAGQKPLGGHWTFRAELDVVVPFALPLRPGEITRLPDGRRGLVMSQKARFDEDRMVLAYELEGVYHGATDPVPVPAKEET